jgi:hypothetical protein
MIRNNEATRLYPDASGLSLYQRHIRHFIAADDHIVSDTGDLSRCASLVRSTRGLAEVDKCHFRICSRSFKRTSNECKQVHNNMHLSFSAINALRIQLIDANSSIRAP